MKKNASRPPWLAYSLILFIILSINGCSVWENFTTYFNLYYNASDDFDEAEALIIAQPKELFQMQELKAPGNASQTLTTVIEKLSKLLQFYNKSSFVDNSLLMIGKAFYYQQDYIKASRKFNELITTFPESDLTLEGMLWLGKSDLRQNHFIEALKILDQVKERAAKEDENEILTQAIVQQISYYIYKEQYPEAVTLLNNLIEVSNDDEIVATGVYELGMIDLELNEFENAAKAFADVKKYSPDFDTDFKSTLELGKVQRRLGHNDEALEIFEEMKSKDIYKDYLDQTELEIGLTLYELKKYDEAFNQLTVVDSTYKQTPSAGIAVFTLGTIMEKVYFSFDSANVYYEKAISSTAPPEYVESARKKNLVIKKYSGLSSSILQLKKQMVYLKNPEEFIKDSIAFAEEQALEDSLLKEKQNALPNEEVEQGLKDEQVTDNRSRRGTQNRQGIQSNPGQPNQNSSLSITVKTPPVMPKVSIDSLNVSLAKNEYDLAGLFFTELEVPDSAFYYYNHILEAYPNSPYQAKTLFAIGSYFLTAGKKEKADSLFEIVYDNFKNESIVNAAAGQLNKPLINFKYDPAEELYVDAENKLKEDNYDQAISGFYYISDNYPKSLFAPKALYASGWILENKLKLLDSAAVVYDSVNSKYARTQYATAVLPKLNMYKAEKKRIQDSIDNANRKLSSDSTKITPGTAVDTTIQNNTGNTPVPNVEQEEFTPNIPPPVSDSLNQNTGIIDTTIQVKPSPGKVNPSGDSSKIIAPRDSLKKNLNPNPVNPGNSVKRDTSSAAPIDSVKRKISPGIITPMDSLNKNPQQNVIPPDSLLKNKKTGGVYTPVDTSTVNKNIRPK